MTNQNRSNLEIARKSTRDGGRQGPQYRMTAAFAASDEFLRRPAEL